LGTRCQHDVVTGAYSSCLIHGALEHGAVHGPGASLVAGSSDVLPGPHAWRGSSPCLGR